MNYEVMSDEWLNTELTEAVLNNRYPKAKSIDFDGTQNCFWVHDTGFSSFKIESYCTDWNATMPLAVEHGIQYQLAEANDSDVHYAFHFDDREIVEDKSLLRAIVICLIKVLEAKKCTSN